MARPCPVKKWRGIAMRSDKLARNYHAGPCLAATPHWVASGLSDALGTGMIGP